MNVENRATKVYIKSLPPLTAIKLIESYHIPTPYKEVLITACVERLEGYKGCDHLAETYKIHIGYWSFGAKLKEALEIFRKSHREHSVDIL